MVIDLGIYFWPFCLIQRTRQQYTVPHPSYITSWQLQPLKPLHMVTGPIETKIFDVDIRFVIKLWNIRACFHMKQAVAKCSVYDWYYFNKVTL